MEGWLLILEKVDLKLGLEGGPRINNFASSWGWIGKKTYVCLVLRESDPMSPEGCSVS